MHLSNRIWKTSLHAFQKWRGGKFRWILIIRFDVNVERHTLTTLRIESYHLRWHHPPIRYPIGTHTGAQNGYYIHLIKLHRLARILSNGAKKCSPRCGIRRPRARLTMPEMGKNWLTPRCHSNNNKFWSIQNIHIFIVRQFPRGRRKRASTTAPQQPKPSGTVTNLFLLANGWGWVVVANRNGCRSIVAPSPSKTTLLPSKSVWYRLIARCLIKHMYKYVPAYGLASNKNENGKKSAGEATG